jgi:REP element-mobilizing transposase RayT
MARHLRIEYPGAFYHVYSRGNQKQPIFLSDEDRYYFLKILRDAHERLETIFHVYCLMNNHYHLVLETPRGNLSRTMHFINTAYSIYINTKHERCGHLFQGRYKAILVEAEAYARTLTKYIHGNPVRDGSVDRPEHFTWSSCQEYFDLRRPPAWMEKGVVMRCFENSLDVLRKEHEEYIYSDKGLPSGPEFIRAARIGILGSDDFVARIRSTFLKDREIPSDGELPELRRLKDRPDLACIRADVMKQLGPTNRLVKKATIFIAHSNADYKLKEIGAFFDICPTAVSVAYRKMRIELSSSEPLRRAIKEIKSQLFNERPSATGKV